MRWRERGKPTGRLVELTRVADPPSAACLVPRDRDVDEPLVEIALLRRRRAPCELEFLMRVEIPSCADQLDAQLEVTRLVLCAHAPTLPVPLRASGRRRTLTAVATILLCGVDLFFRGKLEALLRTHRLVTVDSADEPDLVIVDIARVDPEEVADTYPDVPILGYTNHTDTAGLRAGHAAGFDQVVVKSALEERAGELVDQLTASVE
jgi:hypothetical protein